MDSWGFEYFLRSCIVRIKTRVTEEGQVTEAVGAGLSMQSISSGKEVHRSADARRAYP